MTRAVYRLPNGSFVGVVDGREIVAETTDRELAISITRTAMPRGNWITWYGDEVLVWSEP